jgi:hypothetical protein
MQSDDEKTHSVTDDDKDPSCDAKDPTADNGNYPFVDSIVDRASTSGEETLAIPDDDYGCEHYKRKSKFVVCSMLIHIFLINSF